MALKSRARTGFVYKPRTVDQVKERATRKGSRFDSIFKDGVDTYRSKQGDNLFRYLPPTWDDADHYGYTIFVHNGIGQDNSKYLCLRKMLNKPCPMCEAAKEFKDAGEADESKKMSYSERIVSYVLDRDGDDPEKPLVFEQSWTQDRDVSALCINERSGEILMIDHPDKGYDVSFKKQGQGLRTKYYGYQIARSDSPIHDSEKAQDEILDYIRENPIPELLNYYDYDYLKGVLSGVVPEKDEDLDNEPADEVPATARRGVKTQEVRHEEPPFDEDEPQDDEEDEEATPPPPPSRRATAPQTVQKGRTRVVEEAGEEDSPPPPRRPRTS